MEALVRVAFLKYSNGGNIRLENVKTKNEVYIERPQS
jgi:hypothetical protein